MGSLQSGLPLPRASRLMHASPSSTSSNVARVQRRRPRFSICWRFLSKIRYSQCICVTCCLFFCIFIIQLLNLPGHVREVNKISRKTLGFFKGRSEIDSEGLSFLKELDFGEDFRVEPFKILETFERTYNLENGSVVDSRKVARYGLRKPRLAMVFADLQADSHQIQMATVATGLQHIDYEVEVLALEYGSASEIWSELEINVNVISTDENNGFNVDWLNYDGILVSSLKAVGVISCLMQEPFKNIPLVWTIHEQTLADRLKLLYALKNQNEMIDKWRQVFGRATAIVFPNYILPMAYSICDPGNYLVIPNSPQEAWKAEKLMVPHEDDEHPLIKSGTDGTDDFVIAVVGHQLLYKGLWLEHTLVLQALYPLLTVFSNSSSGLKIVILAGDPTSKYKTAVETIAQSLNYPKETVKCIPVDEDADNVLNTADIVMYGSFREEHTFPGMLLKAMFLGTPIIAPDLPRIRKYVRISIIFPSNLMHWFYTLSALPVQKRVYRSFIYLHLSQVWDRVNGYLFPEKDIKGLREIMFQMVSNGNLSLLAQSAALNGKHTAKHIMVSEGIQAYASLLENIMILPSEVAVSGAATDIPTEIQIEWILDSIGSTESTDPTKENWTWFLDEVEKQFNNKHKENAWLSSAANDSVLHVIWDDQKQIDTDKMIESIEEEESMERTDLLEGLWEEVYRNVRRADRSLHERNGEELERTGQPLCIYEPYFGEGAWPFLHRSSLYRGIRLSTKGKRPGADDVDAPSRLPLLNSSYYREVMGDFGGFLAIANRTDQIHKNAWIGFQCWRVTARKESLSKTAEKSLLQAIEAQRHGDALYFWARMDKDPRSSMIHDFWTFCDVINAGNCRVAFSGAMKRMYGIKQNLDPLPPLPLGKDTFSVMHCWVLPTKSFMEFVMFSRMFVDALDALFYENHQKTGRCYLSLSKGNHCYSRILELLINVWAYHSGRRMVYVDPETGLMQEQHMLEIRRGRMWIEWFDFGTLKSMDQDLAEEFDYENPERHWLWPSTGEVFWKGTYEKEKELRYRQKEARRQRIRERIQRLKQRPRQKALGKYVNPDETNTTKSYPIL
ncbi:hypothetical protein F511_25255 [Dorcoceras hygrometricum]|uniref:Glycosyl transferase family 1 domain-containing protein n=1 Tax=Dorcoceras hygrometricum TaxID=472368 RepID=A0A2Z7BUD0_9LAMI|nr:hypothetical protein F511_25255 [Dorcoceras hygrometricum]